MKIPVREIPRGCRGQTLPRAGHQHKLVLLRSRFHQASPSPHSSAQTLRWTCFPLTIIFLHRVKTALEKQKETHRQGVGGGDTRAPDLLRCALRHVPHWQKELRPSNTLTLQLNWLSAGKEALLYHLEASPGKADPRTALSPASGSSSRGNCVKCFTVYLAYPNQIL